MSDARITRQRIIFADIMNQFWEISFSELKKHIVGKGEWKMDLTTLYRVVEIFKNQGLIHEIIRNNERIIFLCKSEQNTGNDAIEITLCENCGSIFDVHTPLEANYTKSYTEKRIKKCKNCA